MANRKVYLGSKISLLILALLLAFLVNLKYMQYKSQRDVASQTSQLQAQADSLQKQNDDLNQMLQRISSPDFKEQVARQQLGFKKQGENVYGFTDSGGGIPGQPGTAAGVSDFRKWWNYFFAG